MCHLPECPVTKEWSHLVADKSHNPKCHLSLFPLSGQKETWYPIPSQERDTEGQDPATHRNFSLVKKNVKLKKIEIKNP